MITTVLTTLNLRWGHIWTSHSHIESMVGPYLDISQSYWIYSGAIFGHLTVILILWWGHIWTSHSHIDSTVGPYLDISQSYWFYGRAIFGNLTVILKLTMCTQVRSSVRKKLQWTVRFFFFHNSITNHCIYFKNHYPALSEYNCKSKVFKSEVCQTESTLKTTLQTTVSLNFYSKHLPSLYK